MSVLACSRKDCDNVMCDRYSDTYGYLCEDCFDELVAKGVSVDIRDFMRTAPDGSDTKAAYMYFDCIFPYQD